MKIAITGHTTGIGKAIFDRYPDAIGFSRATGYDIDLYGHRVRIARESKDCDVFINNAYYDNAQIELLYELTKEFKGHIINISSNSADGIKKSKRRYPVYKAALDKASEQLFYKGFNVTNVRPGYVDTPRIKDVTETKMAPEYIADIVDWIIKQPHRVKDITVCPTINTTKGV